jgi:hypothetical protein
VYGDPNIEEERSELITQLKILYEKVECKYFEQNLICSTGTKKLLVGDYKR